MLALSACGGASSGTRQVGPTISQRAAEPLSQLERDQDGVGATTDAEAAGIEPGSEPGAARSAGDALQGAGEHDGDSIPESNSGQEDDGAPNTDSVPESNSGQEGAGAASGDQTADVPPETSFPDSQPAVVPLSDLAVFDVTVEEFVARWNQQALPSAVLFLTGSETELTPAMTSGYDPGELRIWLGRVMAGGTVVLTARAFDGRIIDVFYGVPNAILELSDLGYAGFSMAIAATGVVSPTAAVEAVDDASYVTTGEPHYRGDAGGSVFCVSVSHQESNFDEPHLTMLFGPNLLTCGGARS